MCVQRYNRYVLQYASCISCRKEQKTVEKVPTISIEFQFSRTIITLYSVESQIQSPAWPCLNDFVLCFVYNWSNWTHIVNSILFISIITCSEKIVFFVIMGKIMCNYLSTLFIDLVIWLLFCRCTSFIKKYISIINFYSEVSNFSRVVHYKCFGYSGNNTNNY